MANQDMLDEYTGRNNAALSELVGKHEVDVRPLPEGVLSQFKVISEEMYAEMSATDPVFKRVYEHYTAFQKGAQHYHKISEQAYYDTRH